MAKRLNVDEVLDKYFSSGDRSLITKLIKNGFKFKLKKLKDIRTYGGASIDKRNFSVTLMKKGVSVRIISRNVWNRIQIFKRKFTGGYTKIYDTQNDYSVTFKKAIDAKAETIVRKNNIPDPHKLPDEIGEITFNTEDVKVYLEFPHKYFSAKVMSVTGIKDNGNTSEEIINKPGEDVWFVVRIVGMGGSESDLLYRDGAYYSCTYAREEKTTYVPRVSPHPIDITGNDGLLIVAAVDKYMEDKK